jgi:5-methylcytosine-specific restriction endonuclease McrA
MIEEFDEDDFRLSCDHCGETCDEFFETFDDAVDYKVDRDNGWASVKDKNGDWQELCPSCNKPEIIAELKGIQRDSSARNIRPDKTAARLASLAAEDFEGF